MKYIIHKSDTRGFADHGWLKARHSFSFAGYYNPERIRFGLLRVLNDDIFEPGIGFGTHPHDNMEIVTIPLSGALEHKDSEGNKGVIRTNDIQIMSAGSGIEHSEYNHSKTEKINLLQIWVFPKERDIKPRYDQKTFLKEERKNILKTVVSPEKSNGSLWINQDAYFSLGSFDADENVSYKIRHKGNGVYVFVIDGSIDAAGEKLGKRDAIGISDAESIDIKVLENSELLLIEVPMK